VSSQKLVYSILLRYWITLSKHVRIRARLGAVVAVVAIAVSPFTQNIIATRNCQILSTSQTAPIPTTDTYNGWQVHLPRNTNPSPDDFTLWGIDRYTNSATTKASVYSGLYGSSTTVVNASIARPSYPGVNCTFPRYTTLGICHQCADISPSVERVCDSAHAQQDSGYKAPCKWSLPNGHMLQNYADSEAYYKSVNGTTPAVAVNFAFANSTASAIKLLHIPGTFTNVTILANATTKPEFSIYSGNNCGNTIGVHTMELQTIATECSLFPCARTYTAAVINGNVVETEIKQSFRTNPWLTDQESFRKGLIPENIQIDTNEHSTSRTLRSNGTSSPCTYTTGARFIIALGNFFWGFWNATVSGNTYGDASSDSDILDVLYAGGVTNLRT
jgi:hypothetical protein